MRKTTKKSTKKKALTPEQRRRREAARAARLERRRQKRAGHAKLLAELVRCPFCQERFSRKEGFSHVLGCRKTPELKAAAEGSEIVDVPTIRILGRTPRRKKAGVAQAPTRPAKVTTAEKKESPIEPPVRPAAKAADGKNGTGTRANIAKPQTPPAPAALPPKTATSLVGQCPNCDYLIVYDMIEPHLAGTHGVRVDPSHGLRVVNGIWRTHRHSIQDRRASIGPEDTGLREAASDRAMRHVPPVSTRSDGLRDSLARDAYGRFESSPTTGDPDND